MRRSLPAFALFALSTLSLAERVARPFKLEVFPRTVSTPRLAVFGEGWIEKSLDADGDSLVVMGTSGERGKKLVDLTGGDGIDAWWVAPGDASIAWTSGGRFWIADVDKPESAKDLGFAPASEVAFAADGRVAWFVAGKVQVHEKGTTREFRMRRNRTLMGGPAFSGDGKVLFALTSPFNEDANDSVVGTPDAVEALDLATSEWSVAADAADSHTLTNLATLPVPPPDGGLMPAGAGRRVAWVDIGKGGVCDIRMLDHGAGQPAETLLSGERVESLAFTTGGTSLVFTARGVNGRSKAFVVNTSRSGTKRGYAVDAIGEAPDGNLLSPVVRPDGTTWFLATTCEEGTWQVVRTREAR